jgi:oligopeptide transport system ATP-binding protein
MTVGDIIAEGWRVHRGVLPRARWRPRTHELLELVGLNPDHINRYPHQFSGGQRQRISIARAIALNPELVVADEPVSALDVSIQAQFLNLLKDLQQEYRLTYVFISHDLSVVDHFCDRIAVMYLGRIIEIAPKDELFRNPRHPYTQALIEAVPRVGAGKKRMKPALKGEVPSPITPPSGCHFHPRCPKRFDGCDRAYPGLVEAGPDHRVACHLYGSGVEADRPVAGGRP